MWWHTLVILALCRPRQEDYSKFKFSLNYEWRSRPARARDQGSMSINRARPGDACL